MNFLSIQEVASSLKALMPSARAVDLPPFAIVLLWEPSPHLCPLGEIPTTPCETPSFSTGDWVWLTDAFGCQQQVPADEIYSYMLPSDPEICRSCKGALSPLDELNRYLEAEVKRLKQREDMLEERLREFEQYVAGRKPWERPLTPEEKMVALGRLREFLKERLTTDK